jgi:hypothetical protein
MITSKAFKKIVTIIETSAANGLTLSQAMPEILAVKVGRHDGCVNYRNTTGNEVLAYSNGAYALQVALAKVQTWFDSDDEPSLKDLLKEKNVFSVTVAKEYSRLYYDLLSDGINCQLEDILDGLGWFDDDWFEVPYKGGWKSVQAIENESSSY